MALVRATRPAEDHPGKPAYVDKWIAWGAGPRAGQALVLAAKARAALDGRTCATIEDIRAVALPVLRHRLVTTYGAQAEGQTPDTIVAALVRDIPVRPGVDQVDGHVAQVFRS
jgi:MoxR-like ATPase